MRAAGFLVVLTAACSPPMTVHDSGSPPPDASTPDSGIPDAGNPQLAYAYAGCEDAGFFGCPNDGAFYCALRAIQSKYNSCSAAADCQAVKLVNCQDALGSCYPAAVRATDVAAFRAETDVETHRYCDGATCFSSGSCAFSYAALKSDCRAGRCVPLQDDGGM